MEKSGLTEEINTRAASKPMFQSMKADKDTMLRNVSLTVQMKYKLDNKFVVVNKQNQVSNEQELKDMAVLFRRLSMSLQDQLIPTLF